MSLRQVFTFIFFILILTFGCRKERFNTKNGSALEFSTDTVFFDTVFTAVGSATRRLMIRNPHKESIKISKIELAGGKNSFFRLNIDGTPANELNDLVIKGNDSAFVFVEVTINPSNVTTPFIINDSILFETNKTFQKVNLVAWGQNAYYYRASRYISGFPPFSQLSEYGLTSTTVNWKNDKPHVIYDYLMVDSLLTLEIEPGTQIHLHKNAGIWVYRGGSIQAKGTLDQPIVFQGDRLEKSFEENPGQWDRIWINGSNLSSTFSHCIIKNGFVGIQAEPWLFASNQSMPSGKLLLENTIIQNMAGLPLFAKNFSIEAKNCLFADGGSYTIALTGGGNYEFIHSTIVNYWSGGARRDPQILLTNYFTDVFGNTQKFDLTKAYFGNCIIWGTADEEFGYDLDLAVAGNYFFDHCILKTEEDLNNTQYFASTFKPDETQTINGIIVNSLFYDVSEKDFRIYQTSAARNKGSLNITNNLILDLAGNPRDDGYPDLGAYEFKPE